MIELHQYPAIWGLSSLSPFCIKVELYLKKNKIPYRVVVEKNPAKGPNGKMPFIRDGEAVVADSRFILSYLSRENDLEADLAPALKAQGLAFQRMMEEHLYFVLLYSRWIDPAGWKVLKKDFVKLFPPLLGLPFLYFLRHRLRKQAYEQGLGRLSQSEVYALGRQELKALSDFLGSKTYLLGEEFHSVDATLFGFLITILRQPIQSELKEALLSHSNLMAYCEREGAFL